MNPYNQQPSPSYERQVLTPNTEDDDSISRKRHPASASSHPSSSMNSPVLKRGIITKSHTKRSTSHGNSSPLDSFLDFYESIPDYQEVTHLSDKEFSEKMKLLREKQRQYLDKIGGRYCPSDYEDCQGGAQSYEKKSCKSINKLELAKEWVNKSCDSLSSLGRKSENDYRVRSVEEESALKKASTANHSPRKYVQYDVKVETEGLMIDTGSSLSTDSNILKAKASRPNFTVEEEQKPSKSDNAVQDCYTSFASSGRSESYHGPSNFYALKDNAICSYNFYKDSTIGSQSSPSKRKSRPSSCGLQSTGTSELNVQECNSLLGLSHHDMLNYEDYYVPTTGWLQSDSDSMLGTMHHIPSTRPSTGMISQSLPGSPVTKRSSSSSKPISAKKKTR